jgi:hypothetical protein
VTDSKSHAEEYLEGIKLRAAKKLAEINVKQAKEYQDLFPPICVQPDPEPAPDLNAEIMKVLARLRAEPSPEVQVSQKETNGETIVYIQSTRDGKVAKNPLGARGVDAVQVSSHRAPDTLSTILRHPCAWITV